MTTTTTDFLAAQRRELEARRASYLADAARASATALELTEDGGNQDMADEDGFGEGDTLNVERAGSPSPKPGSRSSPRPPSA